MASEIYRPIGFSAYRTTPHHSLVHSKELGGVIELEANLVSVLGGCQGCKTIDDHLASLLVSTNTTHSEDIRRALGVLLDTGLLRPCSHLLQRELQLQRSFEKTRITTIGIVTADRPQLLDRCLRSLADHCSLYGRFPRVVVVDGSRNKTHQEANAAIVATRGHETGFRMQYVGRREAAGIRNMLANIGVSRTCLDFGLSAGVEGANRNLLLLLAGGEDLLFVDDDVVWITWESRHREEGLTLVGHGEAREVDFYPTRADAIAGTIPAPVDFLGEHEAFLGKSVPTLLASSTNTDLQRACGHLIDALREPDAVPFIAVTSAGIAGDSATYCPGKMLFAQGASRNRLLSSNSSYRMGMTSREVSRIATSHIITHESGCQTYCLALSKRARLPPFIPLDGRNTDGVFGAMLSASDPSVFFGHIPYGVIHDSTRPSAYSDIVLRSATETRMSELLIACVGQCLRIHPSRDPLARLTETGRFFVELGGLALPDFIAFAFRVTLELRAWQLSQVERHLSAASNYPHYWTEAIRAYRSELIRAISAPGFFVPIEFVSSEGVPDGFSRAQAFVRDYGLFLLGWDELTTLAHNPLSLDKAGRGLDMAP